MNALKELLNSLLKAGSSKTEALWFLFRLIVFYLILNYFFIAYQGITAAGGKLYSPFIFEHLDFIGAFRRFLLWGGATFASLIGYPSGYTDYSLFVYGGSSVRMVYSCLGFGLMSAYGALILAWRSKWFYQVTSLVIGLIVIILLNMIRLGGLAVLYSTGNYGLFRYFNHHDLFNVIVLLVTFVMFAIHINYSSDKNVSA